MKHKLTNKQISQMAGEECMDKWEALDVEWSIAERRRDQASRDLGNDSRPVFYGIYGLIFAAAVFISVWSLVLLLVAPFICIGLTTFLFTQYDSVIQENEEAYRRLCDFDTPTRRAFMASRIRELRAQR